MSTNEAKNDIESAVDATADPDQLRATLEAMAPGEAEWTLARLASALFPTGIGNFSQLTWPEDPAAQPAPASAASAEAQLRTAELRYRTLIEQIPAVTFMAVLGEGDNEVYVSPHIESLLGFTQTEWLENPFLWYTQLHPEDRDIWHAEFARGCRTGGPFRAECRFLARDGRVVWVRGEARLVKDDVGRPLFLQGVAFDITESKQTEAAILREAVKSTEERYRDLVEHLGAIFWEAEDDPPRFTFVSRGAEHILGYPRARWLAEPEFLLNRIHPDDRHAVTSAWTAARVSISSATETEFRAITADDRTVWLHQKIHVHADQPGSRRFLGMIFDVTDRKRAEQILRVHASRLRAETDIRRTLHRIGSVLAGELDIEKVAQLAADEATTLTGAEFGAFVYDIDGDDGAAHRLMAVSGADRETLRRLPVPETIGIFGTPLRAEGVMRLADVTIDQRFDKRAPATGLPGGHLPVRSYLAVPVVSRTGGVLGGLFFGHRQADRFTEEHEHLAAGIAGWAAVALDNARLYQAAEKARASAETANREKDEFLATMSHELRTPLNAVLGWAAILRVRTVDDATRQLGLETIERNARAQARLIEDLLDISRIVAGKLLLESAPVDLRGVIDSALESIQLAAEAKQIQIRQPPGPRATIVVGDAARLHQAVSNLLTNAIKFTERGGWVEVQLQVAGDTARISVSDNGRGISEEFLPHLFERFRQADQTSTRAHGGLGLGLSIVRHIINLHGGEVRADSAGPGLGATFTIELPALSGTVSPDVASTTPQPASPPQPSLHGLKLLVVEDDLDARDLIVQLLEYAGAAVTATASAAEALALIDLLQPHVIVSDIGMPEQDGYALIREIRQRGGPSAAVPAVAVTAYAGAQDHERALAAGFQEHLKKPIVTHELIAVIERLASQAT
jgi:PAS domain S-box-containing protein